MLIRFGVGNLFSFKEYQQFSMVASSTLKEESAYRFHVNGLGHSLLPIAIIFGANASGKTNLLASWKYFINAIVKSHHISNKQGNISRKFFRLDEKMVDYPTHLDCDVIIDGVRYHYGFTHNNYRILEEWLFAYPDGRKQVWFHRKHGENNEYYFGPNLKGKKQTLAEFTAHNNLFLSIAASNSHSQLAIVRNYFRDYYILLYSTNLGNISQWRNLAQFENEAFRQRIVKFLSEGDIGIAEISMEDAPIPKDISESIVKLISDRIGTANSDMDIQQKILNQLPKQITFSLGHLDLNNKIVFFDPSLESKGTLALLRLAEAIFAVLDKGGTLWIDELSAHLHPLLVDKIISLFGSPETNPKQAQLICITHDTHLLTLPVIHRDQIWFTEKDEHGATRLYPLTDYQVRSRDNVQKEYLRGVFGGIPYLGAPGRLLGKE
ncbi:AAA family ATPase [Candidatus Magnetaquicoccus inordinatus]|uniref:AAA family ATPase n=1 Tax=Candidatus Magnetaquicoccus inordinatus TaxID=2496818 RepID=UPI00187D3A33|nr:ATP-binding protein [Candidatus Magnetaquicoccus inordinatus]